MIEKRFTEGWDHETKHKATSLLNGVTLFGFIGMYRLLHLLIANCLQGYVVNFIKAYVDMSSVIKDVKTARSNIDK